MADSTNWKDRHDFDVRFVNVECGKCGMHIGIDCSYLEHEGELTFSCLTPKCDNVMTVCDDPDGL